MLPLDKWYAKFAIIVAIGPLVVCTPSKCESILPKWISEAIFGQPAADVSAWRAYVAGDMRTARDEYEKLVGAAEKRGEQSQLWNAYMSAAWFYHQIGEDQRALLFANNALVQAQKGGGTFEIGRSLSWLGWTYADMGLYDLALSVYSSAVEIGAPHGKIEIVPVWGMSLQEMGYIYFRKGDLEKARKLISETTNFAREHGISVGVSEGAAHLTEISLTEGKIAAAEKLAKEAVAASLDCNCSPLNTARALLVLAKVKVFMARDNPALNGDAQVAVQQALDYAKKAEVKRFMAEGNILQSKLLASDDFDGRFALVSAAYEVLETFGNEHRGVAQVELGSVFLENNKKDLAAFYLAQGLKVNEEMFRRIDQAYVHGELAKLAGLDGEKQLRIEELSKSFVGAEKGGALELAVQSALKLGDLYEEQGYVAISVDWKERALQHVNTLLGHRNKPETKTNYFETKLVLTEDLVRLRLKLKPQRVLFSEDR